MEAYIEKKLKKEERVNLIEKLQYVTIVRKSFAELADDDIF